MNLKDYDYAYPPDLVATSPAEPRSSSRLLVFDRASGAAKDLKFSDLPDLLGPRDVLILNESKVIPARFFVQKKSGAKLEGLFFEFNSSGFAKVWIQGRLKVGDEVVFEEGLEARVVQKQERDLLLEISADAFTSYLRKNALPALPPYIRKRRLELGLPESRAEDFESYQSIWAKAGDFYSVAAPTASLHFDESIFSALKRKGVGLEKISLHVGAGTFLPLENEEIAQNQLHSERVEIQSETWARLLKYKEEGRRLIAVGTTVTRALESAFERHKKNQSINLFETNLFIYPSYEFQMIDSLITNFHQPKSSLLVLIDTFSQAQWRKIYQHALEERYRLFSYGDALWIQ